MFMANYNETANEQADPKIADVFKEMRMSEFLN